MKKLVTASLIFFGLLFSLTVIVMGDTVGETLGHVLKIEDGFIYLQGEVITKDGFNEVKIKVGDAPIYDLITGSRKMLDDIKIDMSIRAAYLLNEGDTLAQAITIWLNWEENDAAVFTTYVSENITYGEEAVFFLSEDKKYRIVLTLETPVYTFGDKKLSIQKIKPGMEFFVWVDMITAGSPALVYPYKIVEISN